jgi:hypothetical protein
MREIIDKTPLCKENGQQLFELSLWERCGETNKNFSFKISHNSFFESSFIKEKHHFKIFFNFESWET